MHIDTKKIIALIYAFMVVFFAIGLFVSVFMQADEYSTINPVDNSISTGWIASDGKSVDLSDLSSLSSKENLSHIIPENIHNSDALNFNSHNVHFAVYIDGNEIYSYYPSDNMTGRGNGDTYHSIPLAEEYAGEEIILEVEPVYVHESASTFNDVMIGQQNAYYRYIFREYTLSFYLSVFLMFFGAALLLLRFGLTGIASRVNIRAIGLSTLLFGLWASVETTVPTLIFGHSEIWRGLDYFTIPLAEYPFLVFVNSVTVKRKQIYDNIAFAITFVCYTLTTICRIALGIDLHNLPFFFISYVLQIILIIVILYDNHKYTKENGIKQKLAFFYFGMGCFIAGVLSSIVLYQVGDKGISDHGFFTRLGMSIFVVLIYIQILTNINIEQRNQRSKNFINKLLQYSLSASSADKIMKQMIEFIGTETGAKRVYIFEEKEDGFFANSYEWTAEGVLSEKQVLQRVPFVGLLDTWFEDFGKFDFVYIDNLEDYKEKSEPMYEFAKLLDIKRNISGPLIIDGEYIGFFGIDDPSVSALEDIAYSIKLVAYFMAVMLRQRNNQLLLHRYSYRDQMTGVMNRRALEEFIEIELDYRVGVGVLMCDINGLKRVNDQMGHEAGDTMIREVADCLSEVFTNERVFRMGGDEFLVVSSTPNKATFEQRIRTVRLLIEARGRSASMGYTYGTTTKDDFESLQKQADKLMYEDKRAYYEVHPDRRRRE